MRFDAHFGEAEAVQLKAAILLYGGAKRIAFASVHEPYRDPDGRRALPRCGQADHHGVSAHAGSWAGLRDGAGDPAGVRRDANAGGDRMVGAGRRQADVLF